MTLRLPANRLLRIGLVLVIFLTLAGGLAWLLLAPVRQFLAVPMEYLAWLVKTLYLMVPRYLWWVGFLVVGYIIAFNGLLGKTPRLRWSSSSSTVVHAEARVARLARYVRLRGNPFYHHRLNHLVTEATLRALAYREQSSLQEMRLALSHGQLSLPPEVEKFLKAGLPPWPEIPFPAPGFFERWLANRRRRGGDKLDPEQVLDYLEALLEVPRDN